ncbi:MAG: hypothetical protein WCG01_01750 [bacterium]
MKLTTYLLTMIGATTMCWLSFVFVLFVIDPGSTTNVGFMLFYASLFLALVGTGAVIGFLIRFIFLKYKIALRLVMDAFRQSFLFASLVLVALYLLSQGLFTWLNLFLLIAGLAILELFMISYRNTTKQ